MVIYRHCRWGGRCWNGRGDEGRYWSYWRSVRHVAVIVRDQEEPLHASQSLRQVAASFGTGRTGGGNVGDRGRKRPTTKINARLRPIDGGTPGGGILGTKGNRLDAEVVRAAVEDAHPCQ